MFAQTGGSKCRIVRRLVLLRLLIRTIIGGQSILRSADFTRRVSLAKAFASEYWTAESTSPTRHFTMSAATAGQSSDGFRPMELQRRLPQPIHSGMARM